MSEYISTNKFGTNECPNIFVKEKLIRMNVRTYAHTHQRMSEYIHTNKFDTNGCPNIFVKEKLIRPNVRIYICDQYIQIFEYIRHTLFQRHTQNC